MEETIFSPNNVFHAENIIYDLFDFLRWSATRWKKCSQDCGPGRQHRLVFCMRQFPNGTISRTSNHMCTKDKPSSMQNCYLRSCKMKWITKPWSKVSLVHWQAPFYLLIVGLSLAAESSRRWLLSFGCCGRNVGRVGVDKVLTDLFIGACSVFA